MRLPIYKFNIWQGGFTLHKVIEFPEGRVPATFVDEEPLETYVGLHSPEGGDDRISHLNAPTRRRFHYHLMRNKDGDLGFFQSEERKLVK